MTKLTKDFQLVWDDKTKIIIKKGGNATYTNQSCFEANTEVEIDDKIREECLIEASDIETGK